MAGLIERQVTDGLWISDMTHTPYRPMYDAVLTVSEEPGHVDDLIKHRHIGMFDGPDAQLAQLAKAVSWVQAQWLSGAKVLVRSARGVNRPAYVVAAAFLEMGANDPDDAITSVNRGAEHPLQNDTFIDALMSY